MSQNLVAYPNTELFSPSSYSFLSHPPQKPLPSQPLPPPPGYSHISETTAPSPVIAGRRRSSIMISITAWAENVSPGSPAPPLRRKKSLGEPSDECKSALKAAGYTSSIVNLQNVILPPTVPVKKSRYSLIPEPRPSHREVRRTNSQSSLKGSRTRSTAPHRPTTATASADTVMASTDKEHRRERSQSTIVKDKKAKYAKYPAPLDRDLALAQFIDGGNQEDQVRKYVEARAKASGATKVNGQYVGVGDVWRDERGHVWRDQDEELEYTRLLDDETAEKSWVGFTKDVNAALEDEYRRGSVSTVETIDSDLDPRYAVEPNDDELAKFGGAVPPHVPSRHSARHLRKSESLLNPFPVPDSTASPASKERHRPPPLAIDSQSPASPSYVYSPENVLYQEAGRKDFMESSFSPAPVTAKPAPSRSSSGHSDSKSRLGVKGILKAVGMKK